MSVLREFNWLGQMRLDVPHLKLIESSIKADFDVLAGKILAGKKPLVIKGFTISTVGVVGAPADRLVLTVAGGLLMHYGASESGTIFQVSDAAPSETLNATNINVSGSFASTAMNYVGLDLVKAPDTATSDLVQFLDLTTIKESPQTVPLGRTLQYKIIISTQPFSSSSNVLPIAKVETNAGNVVSVTDARNVMFSLASGGDFPSLTNDYSWGTRLVGEDKNITNFKDWMDAVVTSVWEARGGEYWFSPVNRDNVKVAYAPPSTLSDNAVLNLISVTAGNIARAGSTVTVTYTAHGFVTGDYVLIESSDVNFPSGTKGPITAAANTFTYTESGSAVSSGSTIKVSNLKWEAISVLFENSTGSSNTVTNQFVGQPLANGQVLYVDLVRESNATVIGNIVNLSTLGSPQLAGRRFLLAWRTGDNLYLRDRPFNQGRAMPIASTSVLGIVKLNNTAGAPGAPVVPSIMSGGQIEVVATSSSYAIKGTGYTSNTGGYGIYALGGASTVTSAFGGYGVYSQGGAGSGTANGADGGLFIGGSSSLVGGNGITAVGGSGTTNAGFGISASSSYIAGEFSGGLPLLASSELSTLSFGLTLFSTLNHSAIVGIGSSTYTKPGIVGLAGTASTPAVTLGAWGGYFKGHTNTFSLVAEGNGSNPTAVFVNGITTLPTADTNGLAFYAQSNNTITASIVQTGSVGGGKTLNVQSSGAVGSVGIYVTGSGIASTALTAVNTGGAGSIAISSTGILSLSDEINSPIKYATVPTRHIQLSAADGFSGDPTICNTSNSAYATGSFYTFGTFSTQLPSYPTHGPLSFRVKIPRGVTVTAVEVYVNNSSGFNSDQIAALVYDVSLSVGGINWHNNAAISVAATPDYYTVGATGYYSWSIPITSFTTLDDRILLIQLGWKKNSASTGAFYFGGARITYTQSTIDGAIV